MKTIPRVVFMLLLLAMCFTRAFAQGSTSNKGTEFWTLWMSHINGAGTNGSQMNLYITGDITTTGTVEIADGSWSQAFNVTANKVTIVAIPVSAYLSGIGKVNKGIHITSAKNVVVYAHIYYNARSGATLVLPVNAMGKDYYSINYKQTPTNAFSVFCVVGTENNTTVEITPTAALTSGNAANVKFQVVLQKGEVYQALSGTDLSGTHIKSVSSGTEPCKKIAVYSGSTFVYVGCKPNNGSGDNLFQQVYPTSSWGKNFVTAPLANRGVDVFRIVYSDPTAIVKLNGTTITPAQIVSNFYYEFNSNTPNVITSDKPIQVVQYATTAGNGVNCTTITESVGDPEMIYLSPIEQGLDHVTLYSTNQQNITVNYINVIIPSTAVSSFILDGAPYTNFTAIAGSTYSYAQISVAAGTVNGNHNISAAVPFNAIAYGFGNVESYGYAAGTDLKNLNEFIELKDPATNATLSQGCSGTTYKPQLSIPYQTTNIKWDLKDGSPATIQTNPVPAGTIVKGNQTLYVYEYPSTITYNTAGSYAIIATVLNPTADDCGSNEDIEFDYTISDIPSAKFTAVASACPGDVITFTDATDTKTIATKTWAWNFGDPANSTSQNPNTVTTQNPQHIFTKPGDYTVTLTIVNINGCSSTTTQSIHINAVPQASFTASAPYCATTDITFKDTSIPGDGANNKWVWNFGDGGAPVTKTSGAPFTYQYAAANTYHVTLTVTASTGCVSNVYTSDIIVHPLPVVDFTMPDACVNDNTQFTNTTTIADGSDSQLQYTWNFGDPVSGANNTSTLTNPKHKYNSSGVYQVTLTATSKDACKPPMVTTHQFTVNGDTPLAGFNVLNESSLCSANDVSFHDNSSVNFGNVTKLVWYFDAVRNPNQSVTYTRDQFTANKIYTHNYNPLTTATQYTVKLIAYSGDGCFSVAYTHDITVKPSPVVTITPIGPLCQEDSPVTIAAIPANNVTGTGTFTGTGVTTAGRFDPAQSGPGTFTLNYTFVAANGCDYSTTTQVIVYATPKVYAGPDLHMLQGGQITINPITSGDEPLTYKWTLSNGNKATGLDHDDVQKPIATPTDDVTYMLTVTSANGCSASSLVHITVLKAPVVPNTFTPNNDGYNDKWEIKYLDSYPNCTVEIYNRLGEKLYSSIGYPIPWDGNYKGALLPVGTYYYIINPKNGRKVISGSVTIIR